MPLYFRLILLFVCLQLSVPAQKAMHEIPFESLETQSGLTLIHDVYRDSYDFLWVANDGLGLMRYNSYDWVEFRAKDNDSTSLSSNYVRKILEDSKGNLWIGTLGGLDLYQRQANSFRACFRLDTTDMHYTKQYVYDMAEAPNGNIWLATGSGLFEYFPQKKQVKYHAMEAAPNAAHVHTSLVFDAQGNIWLAGWYKAILRYEPHTQRTTKYAFTKHNVKANTQKKIVIDSDGELWLGDAMQGLLRFLPNEERFVYYGQNQNGKGLYEQQVLDILAFEPGKIYVATDQGGINIFDKQIEQFQYISTKHRNAGDLSSDGIYSMHLDWEGILWLGTSRGGVNYYNPQKDRFKNLLKPTRKRQKQKHRMVLSHGVVGAFLEGSRGNLWIGTDGGGINVYNPKTGDVEVYTAENSTLSANTIRALSEDSQGNIWVAIWPGKLNKFIRAEGRFVEIQLPEPNEIFYQNNLLWSAKVDAKDRLWVTYTEGHVLLLNKAGEKLLLRPAQGNPKHYYNEPVFFTNKQGQQVCYVNTSDGILVYNEQSGELEKLIDNLHVLAFAIDGEGNFWLGTLTDGVYQISPSGKLINHLTVANGLSGNCIYSLQTSDNDMVWLATNKGLNQISLPKLTIHQYFQDDGLQSNQYFLQASLKSKSGHLFFGGVKGIDYFDPEKFERNAFMPKVYIERVMATDRKGKLDTINTLFGPQPKTPIKLHWTKNKLTFEFFAINYTYSSKTKYKYRLSGFEDDYHYIDSKSRRVNYTNLKPGVYSFQVFAANNDGEWNAHGKTVRIIIAHPIWARNSFIVICVFVLVGFVYFLFRWRSRILLQEKELLKVKVAERTKTIAGQNNRLKKQKEELRLHKDKLEQLVTDRTKKLEIAKAKAEKSDQLKSYFLANMSHEIRTPLNAIVGFSSILKDRNLATQERHEFIDIIVRSADTLTSIVEDILEFSLIEANELVIVNTPFEINSLLDEVYAQSTEALQNSKVSLRLENKLMAQNVSLDSDFARLKKILDHLMSNAIKFTNKGHIVLAVSTKAEHIEFCVQDSGQGIPPEDLNTIFNRFVKLKKDQLNAKRGMGLGLTISDRLAKLLGGSLRVESEPGKGSRFYLTVPLKKDNT